MQVQIDIGFEQLVALARQLPAEQWTTLKERVEQSAPGKSPADMLTFLLNGPTFSQEQIDEIERTRKEINQWRKNSVG